MRIDTLSISQFKNFSQREFSFHPQFNLIIGTNGSGKTTVLNATAVALAAWSHSYMPSQSSERGIADEEIRVSQSDSGVVRSQVVEIKAKGQAQMIDNFQKNKICQVSWQRRWTAQSQATESSGTITYDNYLSKSKAYDIKFASLGQNIFQYLDAGNTFDLPLIAFYGCDRLWLTGEKPNIEDAATTVYSRYDAYKDCFHTGANAKAVTQWLIKHALASAQQKTITPTLQAILEAAKAALHGCAELKYDFEQSRVMVVMDDGTTIAYEHLSDGQRTMLGLFCDIARRASMLNPHLGAQACLKTKGVVLIDELDLHLHPSWQRRVIEDLRRIFPALQFICTTHSPFLVQSLRSGSELLMLREDNQSTAELGHLSIEAIAAGLMQVESPQVSEKYELQRQASKDIIEMLDNPRLSPEEKLISYKTQLANSNETFANNPALQAMLELTKVAQTQNATQASL
jgi:predicted ATP-binding protein involved in virulence